MASLSGEEENYIRMSLLVTGISPRAARTFFDSQFPPACLDATMRKEYSILLDLKKKHRINELQWKNLFPRFPDVADSKTFDVTLMTLLLRNLTPMTSPRYGFDILPNVSETTQAADLVRIKYYRNYLAHLDDCKIDTTFFNTAWTDVTGAIGRLGGQQMKQECDHLKTKPLDQTNREIMIDVKRSTDEIKEMKKLLKSLKRSHIDISKSHDLLRKKHMKVKKSNDLLQINHKKMNKSHEILKDDHAHMTKEMEIMKISQQDTVPWNIRGKQLEGFLYILLRSHSIFNSEC